jgi:ParB-like nuclease domain
MLGAAAPRKVKAMASGSAVVWGDAPDEHDYPAAADYLALLAPAGQISDIVAALKQAPIVHKKAKDLLRASCLALLPIDNPHVQVDLKKIKKGKALSPILVVRGDLNTGVAMQIADGYHRVCASYYTDENTDIPVRIVPATK